MVEITDIIDKEEAADGRRLQSSVLVCLYVVVSTFAGEAADVAVALTVVTQEEFTQVVVQVSVVADVASVSISALIHTLTQ